MTNKEFMVKRAQDSTSIVVMALYSPRIPPRAPRIMRTSLMCRTSRAAIMMVRRTLSETEIERYGRPKWTATETQSICSPRAWSTSVIMPAAIFVTSTQSIAAGSRRTRTRTNRGKVHETGEGDDPEVRGVDCVATIELVTEPSSDAWATK